MTIELYIAEREGAFCVISETGRKLGCYPSREEAEERLDQVERFAADAVRLSAAAPLALGVDLAQPVVDRPGSRRAWLDLTREGVFAGYPTADGEGIEITRETLGHLLASVKRAETPIPVDGGGVSLPHEMVRDSGVGAAGWILDAAIMEDKSGRAHLWGMWSYCRRWLMPSRLASCFSAPSLMTRAALTARRAILSGQLSTATR